MERVFRISERKRRFTLGKNLLMQALQGERVEQTPWLPHSGTHAAQLLGVSAENYLQDAELLARGAVLCSDRYLCDGIPLLDDPQLEASSLGCVLHWSEQSPPSVISSPLYGLSTEQVVAYLPPLPDETTGRWPIVIAAGKLARPELEKRDAALVGIAAGPCTIAYHLRGLALFTDLFRHPENAEALFAYAGQVSAISARIYAEIIGCDVVAINDTPATMLKPDYFQHYVIPHLQSAWQIIHHAGKISSLWA
jgi:uroporphyrinogen-III decarboxylase